MEERQKEETQLRGKEKFLNIAKKVKNVQIFLAKDPSNSEEDLDDDKSNLEGQFSALLCWAEIFMATNNQRFLIVHAHTQY